MKKFAVILAAAMLFSANASAQSLLSSLKGLLGGSSTTETTTESTTASTASSLLEMATAILGNAVGAAPTFDLAGTWTYTGSAVSLTGKTALAQVGAAAAQSTIQEKVDGYLAKVGVVSGSMVFTFTSDNNFTCQVKGKTLSGTWAYDSKTNGIHLYFGKVMKYLQMDGVLKVTSTGCQMLFTADKFLEFSKTMLAAVKTKNASSTLDTISALLENYEGLYIGFNLTK